MENNNLTRQDKIANFLNDLRDKRERVYWCMAKVCGCIGCVNKIGRHVDAWKEKHPDETPITKGEFHQAVSGTNVVHCKKEKHDVYIGRPSKWGNPFTDRTGTKAEKVMETREEAIESYREWITKGEGKHLLKDLYELKGKTLGCWCKPKSCHGDVLVELVSIHCSE